MPANCRIAIEPPSEDIRQSFLARLSDFNTANGFPADLEQMAIVLRVDGDIAGGLWGKTVYDWLFIEYLVVPDALRGRDLGARLMTMAEEEARNRGCVGAWLTTFTFQARGFYEKLGYTVFGELDQSPRENVRIFMRKRLG